MGFDELKESVCQANLALKTSGLIVLTWGNASQIDRSSGVAAIKPSGVSYDTLCPDDIVIFALEDGKMIEGNLKPSSDAPTHIALYKGFPEIGGIVHTHSAYATSWAQAGKPIPCLGTTHADSFHGSVPVARLLTPYEIDEAYEKKSGDIIIETFREA
ncbi:MAG: L-ribulose-5-phosphate 4-epimerase, partial [Spirochaetales bacterium]|nr:L-ribulose-5-phosphate 4-epimerase [Spirochaetales bacterium]